MPILGLNRANWYSKCGIWLEMPSKYSRKCWGHPEAIFIDSSSEYIGVYTSYSGNPSVHTRTQSIAPFLRKKSSAVVYGEHLLWRVLNNDDSNTCWLLACYCYCLVHPFFIFSLWTFWRNVVPVDDMGFSSFCPEALCLSRSIFRIWETETRASSLICG